MIENIIRLIFPVSCAICGKLYTKSICPKCYYLLKKELSFYTITQKNFNTYFISFYENKIKKLILNFKFDDKAYLADLFSELFIKNKKISNLIKKYDYIVPVPMHIENENIRGYNQTELLAKELEKKIGIKKLNCLEKIKHNKRQSSLTEKERKTNVKDVYKLLEKVKIENKNILLLDDIYTTGSTCKECIKELKKGKVKKVDVLVISKSKRG